MSKLKLREEIDEQFKWDLKTLFLNDDEFFKALEELDNNINNLSIYENKLDNSKTIRKFLDEVTGFSRKIDNVYTYASLRRAENLGDSFAQEMFSKAQSIYAKFSTIISFAEPEILLIENDKLNIILNSEDIKPYFYYFEKLIKSKKHMLSKDKEELLAQLSEVFNGAENTSETLRDADLVFHDVIDKNGDKKLLSEATYITMQMSNDRVLRKNSFDSYYRTYKNHINTFASTYQTYVKKCSIEAKMRGYKSAREMSMSQDDISEKVYDNLINTVHCRMDLMHRYVRLRKRLLHLDELHYYDLYAPLVEGSKEEYTYEQAKQMVLEAVQPLGEEYVKRVESAFNNKWIDVYPNKGKGSGAFSSGTYDSYPYIKLNYTGTLNDVSTLAHEMGHSQHSWLTNHNQPPQYASYTMFVAEVASTVNENLLIEQLLSKETDLKKRLLLLNEYLEGFKGTVYRQTMFAEFEKITHDMVENGDVLSADKLNEVYKKLIYQYFGDDLLIDDEVKYEWARIPHFYYFFYVYVYATGYSSATAISEKILSREIGAVEKYLEFLSMGSSCNPLDELKHAGVDLTTSEPIDIALDKFSKVLDEAEKIADELNL